MPFSMYILYGIFYAILVLLTYLGLFFTRYSLFGGAVYLVMWFLLAYLLLRKAKLQEKPSSILEKARFAFVRGNRSLFPLQAMVFLMLFTLQVLVFQSTYFPGPAGPLPFDKILFDSCSIGIQVAGLVCGVVAAYYFSTVMLDRQKPENRAFAGPFIFLLGAFVFAMVTYLPYFVLNSFEEVLRKQGSVYLFWTTFFIYSLLSLPLVNWIDHSLLSRQWRFNPRRRW